MFGLGTMEIVLVCCALFLLFGTRLPKVMRALGQSIKELRKGAQEISELDKPQ